MRGTGRWPPAVPEYEEHSPLLRLIREDAEALLGGGGAP